MVKIMKILIQVLGMHGKRHLLRERIRVERLALMDI